MSILYIFLSRAKALLRLSASFYIVPIMARTNDSTKTTKGSVKRYASRILHNY